LKARWCSVIGKQTVGFRWVLIVTILRQGLKWIKCATSDDSYNAKQRNDEKGQTHCTAGVVSDGVKLVNKRFCPKISSIQISPKLINVGAVKQN
jgi:hypothetical protein